MIKKLAFGAALSIGLSLMVFSTAQSGNLDIAAGGFLDMPISTDAISATVSNFQFKPSPSVQMTGESDDTCFAEAGVHLSAVGKTDGKIYGMSADSNQIFWADMSSTTTVASITGTTSLALYGYTPGMEY